MKAVRFTNESSAGWLVTTANGYQLCAMQRTRPRTHCVKVGLPLIPGAHFDVARQSVGSQRSSLVLKFPLPVGSGLEAAEPLRNRIRAAFHQAKSELESVLKTNAVVSSAERSMSSLSYSLEEDDPPRLDPVEIVGAPIFEDQAPPIPGDWFFPETPFPIDDNSIDREECKKICDGILQAQVQNVCSKIRSKVQRSLCIQGANLLYSQCLRDKCK